MIDEERDLAEALEACLTLRSKPGRDVVTDQLPDDIRGKIERFDDAKGDLLQIVLICAAHADGLQKLIEAVYFRERDTDAMQLVRERARNLEATLKRVRVPPGGAVKPRLLGGEGKYALVVGINRYDHPKRDNRPQDRAIEPEDWEFKDLSFAERDATDLCELLVKQGYDKPKLLLNEKATLRGIMNALDDLRRVSRRSKDPLVLFFFSGHGVRDDDDRDYLIPYDGKRNELFATALWSKTLDSALAQFQAQLVVILDACHAGGLAEDAGAKGGNTWSPSTIETTVGDTGASRYVLASCMPGQRSYEEGGHGVFTSQLLGLLRCEREEDSPDENVDLFDLSLKLKERVVAAAEALQRKQEPYTNVKQTTHVIVTVNQPRQRNRLQKERTLGREVLDYLDRNEKLSEVLRDPIEAYMETGDRTQAPRRFYDYFRQMADLWKPDRNPTVPQICDGLIKRYSESDTPQKAGGDLRGSANVAAAPPPAAGVASPISPAGMAPEAPPTAGSSSLGADSYSQDAPAIDRKSAERRVGIVAAAESNRRAGERLGDAMDPAHSPASDTADKRRFSQDDRNFVRSPVWTLDYQAEGLALDTLLKQAEGVDQGDIMSWASDYSEKPREASAGADWDVKKNDVLTRFKARWATAKPTMQQKAFGVRTGTPDA